MVTVVGLGFVGLTTALGFAHLGYDVYGIDIDETRKTVLREGQLPFLEPHMDQVLKKHLDKNFFVADDLEKALKNSKFVFYCVGTPYGAQGEADLTYLFQAIDETIAAIHDEEFRVLVTKSTIPPSTTAEKILPYVQSKGEVSCRLGVANNPEFLREGHCWMDFIEADRIVLGCNDERSENMLMDLYRPLNVPVFTVSHNTGEFIKYLSNSLLATLISYSNEMAQIADTIGDIEVASAFKILHMDKRWNHCNMTSYVYPGCGYGGYCLPKDTCALYAQANQKGVDPQILKHVIQMNEQMPEMIAKKICFGLTPEQNIGILGLAFKPNSDDVRDTPAAKIIRELQRLGYQNIYVYDPVAGQEFKRRYGDLQVGYCGKAEEVYDKSDVIAVVTAWHEFKDMIVLQSGDKPIIDCRYML